MEDAEDDLVLYRTVARPSSKIARRAVDATIKRARADGRLPDGDGIEVAMLRGLADRLDWLRLDEDPKTAYAEATIQRQLLETLRALGLIGASEVDAVDRLLAAMDAEDDEPG